MQRPHLFFRLLSIAAACAAGPALATNGYFPHGYGMKAKGMAGAATAMAIDTFGGAVNPAKHGLCRRSRSTSAWTCSVRAVRAQPAGKHWLWRRL